MRNSKFVGFSLIFLAVILFAINANAATFTVINTNDAGVGSLRQAITDAASAAGVDTIAFNIPGGGVKKIAPLTELPSVNSTIIDATTQPGWSVGNLMIELSGENLTDENARGLKYLSLSGATPIFVRGLIINRFQGDGIYIQDSQNLTVEGCFIGTDASGTVDFGNSDGIEIRFASTFTENITIGGDTAAERNVISGNSLGIRIFGGNDYFIKGNYIGTDKTGNEALPNGSGMQVSAILVVIGGATTAERNVISGNNGRGIILDNSQNTVRNNYIGVGANGFTPLGNGTKGIDLINSLNLVNTGSHLISDNVIAFNKRGGISTFPANKRPTNNKISNNSIFANESSFAGEELGIDLEDDDVTANDTGDADTGANNLQNFPVLTSAVATAANTTIQGTFNSEASTSYRIEFFVNTGDQREGKTFLGFQDISTNASGNANINAVFSTSTSFGQFITATATRNVAPLDTSEFSAPVAVSVETFIVTNANNSGAGSLRQAMLDANANANPNLITFAITPLDGNVKTINLTSQLPTITNPLSIDGLTQNGASCSSPKIELNGASAGAGGEGFTVSVDNTILQGFVINRYLGNGILATTNNNTFRCNKIGTNPAGTTDLGNSSNGILLDSAAHFNIIESSTISGNGASGIRVNLSNSNTIQDNIVGLSSDGTLVVPNASGGIFISGGNNNVIGGGNSSTRNVVSGNGNGGILLGATNDNRVSSNYIGVDTNGGGTTFGNTGPGILIFTTAAGNVIGGVDANGIQTVAKNIIAHNATQGISFFSNSGAGNRMLSNDIYDNGGMGIDINNDGVATANDLDDVDTGANNQQNFPVISAAEGFFGGLKLTGTLNSTANSRFRIEFFGNPTCDASGSGEGKIYLGTITLTTDAGGDASFSNTFATSLTLGETVSATATRRDAPFDTSEFSQCRTITALTSFPTLIVTNTNNSGAGSLRQVIDDANATVTPKRITFNISGGGVKTITPLTNLPNFTVPVIVDGLSQPGATCATPLIELNGSSVASFGNGFRFSAGGEVIGLVVRNWNAVGLNFGGADGNVVKCSRFGTDAAGLNPAPNLVGIGFTDVDNNTVGGTAGDGNLFNGGLGISFTNSENNTVQGNIIGLDKNGNINAAFGNTNGIQLSNSHNNLIGGNTAAARNLVARCSSRGIYLINSSQTAVKGNFIGLNGAGDTISGAMGIGIEIFNSSEISVGGNQTGDGNVIVGGSTGISVFGIGSSENTIKGNLIGTNATGNVGLGGATQQGVRVTGGGSATIGGRTAAERNVISGNIFGIRVETLAGGGESPNAVIEGNYIGLGADGTTIVANSQQGIFITNGAVGNQIGGTAPGAGNVISGNTLGGISINTSGNVIQGNLIGTDAGGTLDKGNGGSGIVVSGGSANIIGGTTAEARNIISGNTGAGIGLVNAAETLILNNFIGTNAAGNASLPNGNNGINLNNSTNNVIGNSTSTGNIISASVGFGMQIFAGSSNNVIQGNLIGTDVTGTLDFGNGNAGIQIGLTSPNATGNIIGGASASQRNVISGNNNNGGIYLEDFAIGNTVQNNLIGTAIDGTTALGNTGFGINIDGDSNIIGAATAGNTIQFNSAGGIVVGNAGIGNAIRGNSIFSNGTANGHLGIDLGNNGVTNNDTGDGDLANNQQNFPVITDAGTNIVGTFNSTANATFTLDFYLNPVADTSNFGEGKTYLGAMNVTTNGSGNASFTFVPPITLPPNQFVVATATNAGGDTSEFSQNRQIAGPLAANVNIQGRVLSNDGRAISKAMLTLVEPNGNIRYAMTNPFGYFQFLEVPAGETYTLNVSSKTYDFIPSVFIINLSEEITDLTIIGTHRENLNEENPPGESPNDAKKP